VSIGKIATVNVQELRDAFDLVSIGSQFDVTAYICLETGKIYCSSVDAGLEDDALPEDVDDATRYLAVPSQHDLDLGRRLALAFVAEKLPDDHDTVAGFFRRRGAFARFKELLAERGKLAGWYDFEAQATDEALRAWCADHGIELVAAGPGA